MELPASWKGKEGEIIPRGCPKAIYEGLLKTENGLTAEEVIEQHKNYKKTTVKAGINLLVKWELVKLYSDRYKAVKAKPTK